MSRPSSTDSRLTAWLEEGPTSGSDAGLSEALARAHATRQRPGWLVQLRGGTMETTWRARPVLTTRLTFAMLMLLLLLALTGSGLLIGSRLTLHQTLTPAFPEGGAAVLAYSDLTDGQLDIYTIRADGTERRRVTTDPSDEDLPVFSPDGSVIAYHVVSPTPGAPRELRVIDATGTSRTLATNVGCGGATRPAWSPDGRFIIYAIDTGGCDDETENLWVVAVDGRTPGRSLLGSTVSGFSTGADWSPDGSQIAFQVFDGDSSSLWVADVVDATAPYDLEARQLSPGQPYAKGSWQAPAWSPDGTMIASLVADPDFTTQTDVIVITADGTSVWSPLGGTAGLGDEVDSGWHPDSGNLVTAVNASPAGSNADGFEPYQVPLGDGGPWLDAHAIPRPTMVSGWVRLQYSPDGGRIVGREPATSADGPPGALVVIVLGLNGDAAPVRIPAGGSGEPDWQPWLAPLPPAQPIP